MPPETTTVTNGSAGTPGTSESDLRTLSAGLDALQTDVVTQKSLGRRIVSAAAPTVVLLIGLIAVWQLVTVVVKPRPDLYPGPFDVLGAFGSAWDSGRIQEAVATSVERGGFGFLLALAIGAPLGLILAEVPLARRALRPLLSGLQVLPSVAWVPPAIIWFGISDATAYFVVIMGAAPSIANGLVSGIDQVPPQLRRVGRVLGASRLESAMLIALPAALPGFLGGLKQGWAFSWRSLMAAEIISTGLGLGLGGMLDQSRQLADMAGVLATILVILAIGVTVELLIFGPIERGLLRRRGLYGVSPR
ncbi:MAG TPA: ABC transporter permease [Pseudolysinimonas sp.]|nr:ABC transporter permease [Pseudolysinimonas sp.]